MIGEVDIHLIDSKSIKVGLQIDIEYRLWLKLNPFWEMLNFTAFSFF
jgi:hypothetical protein